MPIVDLTPCVVNGIRPEADMPVNAPFCAELQGLRCTKRGAKQFPTIQQWPTAAQMAAAWGGAITNSWPFPQLLRLKGQTIVMTAAKQYAFSEATNPGFLLAQTLYNANRVASPVYEGLDELSPSAGTVSGSGLWHVADFGSSIFLFNGTSTIFTARGLQWVQNNIWIKTGCCYREGRAVFGVDSGLPSIWETFLAAYDDKLPDDVKVFFSAPEYAGSDCIWWSSIGGGDLFWWFSLKLMQYGSWEFLDSSPDILTGYGPTKPFFFELLKRNQCGFRNMPWRGAIHKVAQLGKHVMIYGTGIAAMTAFSEPQATLGLIMSDTIGVKSRTAIGCGDNAHIFIDDTGELWIVNEDLSYSRLGYKTEMAALTGTVVISYEPRYKEFWISNGTITYTLTETGLCKAPVHPSSIHIAPAFPDLPTPGAVGCLHGTASTAVVWESHPFALSEPALLNMTKTRVCGKNASQSWTQYVKSTRDQGATWYTSAAMTPSLSGKAFPMVSGVLYKLRLEAANYANVDIDGVFVELETTGKRKIAAWLS